MIHHLAQSQEQKYVGSQCIIQVPPPPLPFLQNDDIQQESAVWSPKAVVWKHKHKL